VLEVGCGTGSMTEALAEKAGRVICVELDKNLSEIAAMQLARSENIEIINTDILESKNTLSQIVTKALDLAGKKCPGRMLLVANLPYSAASPVIMNLITGPTIADCMYVTVQKEVADRMTASPGSSHYGQRDCASLHGPSPQNSSCMQQTGLRQTCRNYQLAGNIRAKFNLLDKTT